MIALSKTILIQISMQIVPFGPVDKVSIDEGNGLIPNATSHYICTYGNPNL